MADESLDILIRTTADTSGAFDAEGSIKRITGGMKDLGGEVEKGNLSVRQQMFLLRQLGPEFSHLGHLGHIALEGGIAVPAALAALAIAEVIKHTKEANEKMKEMADNTTEAWRAAGEAARSGQILRPGGGACGIQRRVLH